MKVCGYEIYYEPNNKSVPRSNWANYTYGESRYMHCQALKVCAVVAVFIGFVAFVTMGNLSPVSSFKDYFFQKPAVVVFGGVDALVALVTVGGLLTKGLNCRKLTQAEELV